MSKSLTSEEKLQLRNKAKQECLRLEKVYADKATMEVVENSRTHSAFAKPFIKPYYLNSKKHYMA